MTLAHGHGDHASLLVQHAGHLGILLAWLVIFGLVLARQRLSVRPLVARPLATRPLAARPLAARPLVVRPLRPGPGTLAMAGGVVLAGGLDWVVIGQHATSAVAATALVVLTVTQLVVAGLIATHPSDLLVRAVATACVAIGLWWVLDRGLSDPATAWSMADVVAFSAELGTAACGWSILARTPTRN